MPKRPRKQERPLHLKSQNTVGASTVADYMANNMAVHSGVLQDQMSVVDRVGVKIINFQRMFYDFYVIDDLCINRS